MSKYKIEFEGKSGCQCGGTLADHEISAEWCGFKKDAKDMNEILCVGLGRPGCPAELIIPPAKCQWHKDGGRPWQTSCHHYHVFLFHGPKENKAIHCQYCGREIEVVK